MKKIIFLFFALSTYIYSQNSCQGVSTFTYSGKTYHTVQIGTQCWLEENLDVGTMIQGNQDQTNNNTIEKYCYNDDVNNCTIYGGLYQWAEAVQYKNGATNTSSPNPAFSGNIQGICPTGWHIPTSDEFQTLSTTVNNNSNALKAIGQGTGSGAGTNTSGFSSLLSGARVDGGNFQDLNTYANFWSSTVNSSSYAYDMILDNAYSGIYYNQDYRDYGISIRCLKDGTTAVGSDNEKEIPLEYSLSQNYPNPFNPSTLIRYQIPTSGNVTLKVYDVLGKEVASLVNEYKPAGRYEVTFDAQNLTSGVYFYRLQAGGFFKESKKMIVVK